MTAEEAFLRLAVALFAGLLIGTERGWQRREAAEGERAAGIRTFGLIALAGALWHLLGRELGALVLGAAALVLGLMLIAAYWLALRERHDYSLTSEVAALVTFALGALAMAGYLAVTAAVAVVTALLLGLKLPLHGALRRIEETELRAALQLLLVSVVVLPVLPDQGYGPWDALNPRNLWAMVVLIVGIGFIGYVAVRIAGTRYGLLLTGLAAGLMASTPLALAFARLGRSAPANAPVLVAAILAASSTMFPRALAVASLIAPALLAPLAPPLLAMMLAGYAAAGYWWWRSGGAAEDAEPPLTNPFELLPALRFGALLAAVTLAAHALQHWVGDAGLYGLALVSGLTDVDAITLSLAGFAGETAGLGVAATGIVLAAMANTVFKAALVAAVGGRAMGAAMAGPALLILGAGGAVLAL